MPMSEEVAADEPQDQEQSFISHLVELRSRLLAAILSVLLIFLALFYFANDIYEALAQPLLRHLPAGTTMIATEVASPFLAPFKLTLMVSLIIAMPYVLYQMWAFVAPGLYRHERRLVMPLLLSSTLLFYAGIAFAYFVVFPLVFGFFTSIAPEGVTVMTDISSYLDFVLKLFFAFGLAFEVPVATVILIRMGIVSAERLGELRPHIIVGAFCIGMLLTPPDVVSQVLLAVPMWVLFEIGLVMARYLGPAPDAADATDGETTS